MLGYMASFYSTFKDNVMTTLDFIEKLYVCRIAVGCLCSNILPLPGTNAPYGFKLVDRWNKLEYRVGGPFSWITTL